MNKVYSLGYDNVFISNLKKFIFDNDIMLVDVRYSPTSYSIYWRKKFLQTTFSKNYIHLKELGNVNYRDESEFKINDIEKGMSKLLSMIKDHNVVIMCVCSDINTCHRQIISDELESFDIKCEEVLCLDGLI